MMRNPFRTIPWSAFAVAGLVLIAGCDPGAIDEDRMRERDAALEARFTPGLHSLMVDMGMRHASVWFAGDAENWALADYMVHELEELVETIEELHPVYREIRIADRLREMTWPAIERVEAAVEARDRAAFVAGFDQLTTACNSCHKASDREAIVIQRPTAPPLSNLRYAP